MKMAPSIGFTPILTFPHRGFTGGWVNVKSGKGEGQAVARPYGITPHWTQKPEYLPLSAIPVAIPLDNPYIRPYNPNI